MFLSGFIGFLKSQTRFWQKPFTYFCYKKKESEIFQKAENYLRDIVAASTKKIFSQIGQNLTDTPSGKVRTPGKPVGFMENCENRLTEIFPRTRVSSF